MDSRGIAIVYFEVPGFFFFIIIVLLFKRLYFCCCWIRGARLDSRVLAIHLTVGGGNNIVFVPKKLDVDCGVRNSQYVCQPHGQLQGKTYPIDQQHLPEEPKDAGNAGTGGETRQTMVLSRSSRVVFASECQQGCFTQSALGTDHGHTAQLHHYTELVVACRCIGGIAVFVLIVVRKNSNQGETQCHENRRCHHARPVGDPIKPVRRRQFEDERRHNVGDKDESGPPLGYAFGSSQHDNIRSVVQEPQKPEGNGNLPTVSPMLINHFLGEAFSCIEVRAKGN